MTTTDPPTWVAFGPDIGDDAGRKPIRVRRACDRCYGSQVSVHEIESIEVVSTRGTVHKPGENGRTDCGIVIRPSWWQSD